MATIPICTRLRNDEIEDLRNHGAVIRDVCKSMLVIELLEPQCINRFSDMLVQREENVDLLLRPNFGLPTTPYVEAVVQQEIYQLLTTYRSVMPNQATKLLPAIIPIGGGVQFCHAISIHRVIEEIENSNPVHALPGLTNIDRGTVICDMNIVFANCNVVRRICK